MTITSVIGEFAQLLMHQSEGHFSKARFISQMQAVVPLGPP